MIIEIFLLLSIGLTSYFYTSYLIPLAAFIMPIEQHYMIICFSCILLIIDNVSLFNDLQNKNTNTNLQIVGDQVFELTDNKVIVYNITKIKDEPITPTSKLKLKRNILNKNIRVMRNYSLLINNNSHFRFYINQFINTIPIISYYFIIFIQFTFNY